MSDTVERDALAEVIHENFNACRGRNGVSPTALADVILAAGWGRANESEGRRQFTAAYRATNGNVISLETPNMLREAAEKTVAEFAEEDPEGPDYFVATRILPPWVPVKQEGRVTPETVGVADHKAEEEASDVPALDPQPWLFISDQVFGEFRSDHDKGYHGVSGTYWVFSPREGFEKDRARYDDANDVNGAKR